MDMLAGSSPLFGGIAVEQLTGVVPGSLEAWAAVLVALCFWHAVLKNK